MKKLLCVLITCMMCLSLSTISFAEAALASDCTVDLESCMKNIYLGSWCAGKPQGADHIQGICVDDEGKYMYASFTNMVVKADIATGEIVGTMVGLATGTLVSGAHIGELTYYNGKIYAAVEYKASERWYIAVIDGDLITEMNMHYTTPGMMKACYVPQVGDAFVEEFDAGEHNNTHSSMGHRYGAAGIDAMTIGKIPGGGYDTDGDGVLDVADDKDYLFTVLVPFQNPGRYDNENTIFLMYDLESFTEQNLVPFSEDLLAKDYTAEDELLYKHKIFCYAGNRQYGAQQLELDKDTGDYIMECYGDSGKSEFPGVTRLVVDSSVPLYMDEVEVGQSVTGDLSGYVTQSAAHTRAAYYTDYEDGDGDGDYNEQETGWHMTLKCLCGGGKTMEDHEAEVYGKTGHPAKVCGTQGHNYALNTGLTSLGNDYFYMARHRVYESGGEQYYSADAYLVRLNRETWDYEACGSYLYEDYERLEYLNDGAHGSRNALRVNVTSTWQDVDYRFFNPAKTGDNLYFSAWIKVNNTELTNDKVSFILWSESPVVRTSDDVALQPIKMVHAFLQIDANATGLRKGEWVQVSAKKENWNGKVQGMVPAGYNGQTESAYALIDCDGLDMLTVRLYGPEATAEDVSAVEYDIDDVSFYASPAAASVQTADPEIFKGSAMDTAEDVAKWSVTGKSLVAETGPDGSKGYMRIAAGTSWPEFYNGNITIKPNHLYKISLWVRVEEVASGESETGGIWLLPYAGGRIPDTNGYNVNYPGPVLQNVISKEWNKVEFYYLKEFKTFVEEPFSWRLRLFQGTNSNANSSSVYNVDDVRLTDLGEVTNGDFSTGTANVYIQKTGLLNAVKATYPVLGWNQNGATTAVENGAMKITVNTDGGNAYQGINMINGGTYKMSFKAKTNSAEEKPLAAVLDRYVATKGGDAEVYDVPDYQYITGKYEINTSYTDAIKAKQEWKVTDEWQTFECFINNEFPLLEGKTAVASIIPRTPYLYFDVDGNKAGTELYIDDVVLEYISMTPTVSGAAVSGVNKPDAKLTVSAALSSPKAISGGDVMIQPMIKTGSGCISLGVMYPGNTFIVPENAIGKELVFAFTPIDGEGVVGETVYVTPDAATEDWAKLYLDREALTARAYVSYATDAEVIFASYKGKVLVDVKVVPVSMIAETKSIADGSALITTGADTVKVMLWNSATGAIPLCENVVTE